MRIAQMLASRWHVGALAILGIYLVVLPLLGITVSPKAELIGGNYTNVISAIGAGLASYASVAVHKSHKSLRDEMHALLGEKAKEGVESPSQGESPTGSQ